MKPFVKDLHNLAFLHVAYDGARVLRRAGFAHDRPRLHFAPLVDVYVHQVLELGVLAVVSQGIINRVPIIQA